MGDYPNEDDVENSAPSDSFFDTSQYIQEKPRPTFNPPPKVEHAPIPTSTPVELSLDDNYSDSKHGLSNSIAPKKQGKASKLGVKKVVGLNFDEIEKRAKEEEARKAAMNEKEIAAAIANAAAPPLIKSPVAGRYTTNANQSICYWLPC